MELLNKINKREKKYLIRKQIGIQFFRKESFVNNDFFFDFPFEFWSIKVSQFIRFSILYWFRTTIFLYCGFFKYSFYYRIDLNLFAFQLIWRLIHTTIKQSNYILFRFYTFIHHFATEEYTGKLEIMRITFCSIIRFPKFSQRW